MTVKWDRKPSEVFSAKRLAAAQQRAMQAAGGDALRTLDVESRRAVRESWAFPMGLLINARRLVFPRLQAGGRAVWELIVKRGAVGLGSLPHRQTAKGVSVEERKGQRTLHEGAFVAKTHGRRQVFVRANRDAHQPTRFARGRRYAFFGKLPEKYRTPLERLVTRVTVAAAWRATIPGAMEKARSKFRATWTRVLKAELDKSRPR